MKVKTLYENTKRFQWKAAAFLIKSINARLLKASLPRICYNVLQQRTKDALTEPASGSSYHMLSVIGSRSSRVPTEESAREFACRNGVFRQQIWPQNSSAYDQRHRNRCAGDDLYRRTVTVPITWLCLQLSRLVSGFSPSSSCPSAAFQGDNIINTRWKTHLRRICLWSVPRATITVGRQRHDATCGTCVLRPLQMGGHCGRCYQRLLSNGLVAC